MSEQQSVVAVINLFEISYTYAGSLHHPLLLTELESGKFYFHLGSLFKSRDGAE